MKLAIAVVACLLAISARADLPKYGPYPEQTYQTCGNPQSKIAVAIMHGGWNVTGSDDNLSVQRLCRYLGGRGIFGVAFNYRLAGVPGQSWPAQWQDAQLMIRWLRAQNYERVGIVGTSAGAYNVVGITLKTATIEWAATDSLNEAALYPNKASNPNFAVAISPFSDLNDTQIPARVAKLLTRDIALPGMAQATKNSLASPVTFVHRNISPLLVIHGINDQVVPFSQSQTLSDAMRIVGGNMQLYQTNGGHVFVGLSSDDIATVLRLIAQCAKGTAGTICAGSLKFPQPN